MTKFQPGVVDGFIDVRVIKQAGHKISVVNEAFDDQIHGGMHCREKAVPQVISGGGLPGGNARQVAVVDDGAEGYRTVSACVVLYLDLE